VKFRPILPALICLALAAFPVASAKASAKLLIYPAPHGVALNANDFSVRARTPGGQWQIVPVYLVQVAQTRQGNHVPVNSSMATFDFSGRVQVEVTSSRPIASARVRPLSYDIQPSVHGRVITFTLDRPRNLSVEVNGDIFGNLQLFANSIEKAHPTPTDPNVIYFGPGLHVLPVKKKNRHELDIPSGKTVYLAGGAVVRGSLICEKVHDVRILGHGMLEPGDHGGGVRISHSQNVEVSGIIVQGCFTGGSQDVHIRNVKCISHGRYGDGMDVISSSRVTIDGVFNRNSDDCIAVYATRNGYTGGSKDIIVRNSILWADVAHPILVGTHGNTKQPETIENLTFRNLDILDQAEAQLDYQGCLALNAGDSNLIRNVLFDDIGIEDIRQGQVLNLRVFYNRKYNTSPGRGIENVTFRGITYTGTHAEVSQIIGYDDSRMVKNVRFENLVINGTHISDHMKKPHWYKTSDMARIFVGEHVQGLKFQ
jgi:hypothetical protein